MRQKCSCSCSFIPAIPTVAALKLLLLLCLFIQEAILQFMCHMFMVFMVHTCFIFADQSPDAENSNPDTDTELKNSHGDQRGVHGCLQTLMDEKIKHFEIQSQNRYLNKVQHWQLSLKILSNFGFKSNCKGS